MHKKFMLQAIEIAQEARFKAPGNPWVGCVIAKNNEIVGMGHTQTPGQSHAEICALQHAKQHAVGATMYVSLEPCSHFGRTPPCTDAIIKSGISEIFIAQQDPDVSVRGQGITLLKNAGIKVNVGLCEKEAQENLRPYLYQRKTGLPYTILKAAISIDGRTATKNGTSQWITSEAARHDAHLLRAHSQAIVIGSTTALNDNPRLTIRREDLILDKQPLRVILDSKGKLKPEGNLFDQKMAPSLIFTTEKCPDKTIQLWIKAGAEVEIIPSSEQGVDLLTAWQILGKRGILQALVEGGSFLQTQLLKTALVKQLILYMGPLLLGSEGLPLYGDVVSNLTEAPQFTLEHVHKIGDCVRLDYLAK